MAEKIKEDKMILEREYIVPLRKKWLKVPKFRRTPKAIRALKEFIVRHMKVYDRDLRKVKIDKYLNEELWQRSIGKPPAKIKVKCKKFESGIVRVELADIPQFVKWKIQKAKKKEVIEKEEKKEESKKTEETKEEKKEEEEKKMPAEESKKSEVEAGLKGQKLEHIEQKHEVKMTKMPKHAFRKALQK